MVGITLSPEQIRQAPPEIRRWLEQQIAGTLGLYPAAPAMQAPAHHLVGCDVAAARSILSLIQGSLPVVSVFFELGRDPVATSPQGLRALALDDIARHVHLQNAEQVAACLAVIDEALQRACNQPDAALTALDGAGHCLVADTTARSILALWREIIAAREVAPLPDGPDRVMAPAAAPATFQSPHYAMSMPGISATEPDNLAS